MTAELSKNFHGVGIGTLPKILADKVLQNYSDKTKNPIESKSTDQNSLVFLFVGVVGD